MKYKYHIFAWLTTVLVTVILTKNWVAGDCKKSSQVAALLEVDKSELLFNSLMLEDIAALKDEDIKISAYIQREWARKMGVTLLKKAQIVDELAARGLIADAKPV